MLHSAKGMETLNREQDPARPQGNTGPARAMIDIHPFKWCVYAHFHGNRCIYVGAGTTGRPFDISSSHPRSQEYYEFIQTIKVLSVHIFGWFDTKKEAHVLEASLIRSLHPVLNKIYNGFVKTNITRRRLSQSLRGKKFTNRHRQNLRLAKIGARLSLDHKNKIGASAKKWWRSKEGQLFRTRRKHANRTNGI